MKQSGIIRKQETGNAKKKFRQQWIGSICPWIGLYGDDRSRFLRFLKNRDDTRSLHKAVETRCAFFDTAEVYCPFTNEELFR
jgi:hypothetical protein